MEPYDKIRDILVGLEIFKAHGGDSCQAEHDQFWSQPKSGTILSADEITKLEAAGWFRDSDCCDGEDCTAKIVDGEEIGTHSADCNAWSIYT